jgi:hypothetical protein
MLKNRNKARVTNKKPVEELQSAAPMPVKLYTTIETLPLSIFIDCIVTADLSGLIISGEISLDELNICWLKLQSQYYELIKSPEARQYIKLVSQIEKTFTKMNVTQKICDTLRWEYSDKLVEELRAWGYNYEFKPETLENDLARVISETRNDLVRLKQMQALYEKNHKDSNEKPSKEGFQRLIFDINKTEQSKYRIADFTTYEFGVAYNRLMEYIQYLKSQSHGS